MVGWHHRLNGMIPLQIIAQYGPLNFFFFLLYFKQLAYPEFSRYVSAYIYSFLKLLVGG